MMIIQVKNRKVLAMGHLWRAVLKFIYDEKNMGPGEIREMQASILGWKNAIDLEDEKLAQIHAADLKMFGHPVTTHHIYSEQKILLQEMADMLHQNDIEDSPIQRTKAFIKRHNIDYRKYYRLPEAYTVEGKIKAQEALKQSMADHPEEYQ